MTTKATQTRTLKPQYLFRSNPPSYIVKISRYTKISAQAETQRMQRERSWQWRLPQIRQVVGLS